MRKDSIRFEANHPIFAFTDYFYKKIFLTLFCCTSIALSGCTAPNYVWPAYDKITLYANPQVNPDDNNRPSPMRIKIYELAARTTFDNLDFQSLFLNGSTLLSDELISEETFVIQPNETLSHKIELSKAATHIAIIAAYRKIDDARWKHIYPVKSYGYYNHEIELTNNAIEIKKSERSEKSEDTEKKERIRSPRKDRNEKNVGTKKSPVESTQKMKQPESPDLKKTGGDINIEKTNTTDAIKKKTESNQHQKVHEAWST